MPDKKAIFGTLFVIFLASILFTYQNTDRWQGLLFLGIIFGALWFTRK